MPVGIAAILVTIGGFTVYVVVWVAVLCVREVLDRRAVRRAEYKLIATHVAETQARPQHALIETADVVLVTPLITAPRRRVVCPVQPHPPAATGHTTSTPRHARAAS